VEVSVISEKTDAEESEDPRFERGLGSIEKRRARGEKKKKIR
jgi:hypothetical protein